MKPNVGGINRATHSWFNPHQTDETFYPYPARPEKVIERGYLTHQRISFLKSGLRFIGYGLLVMDITVACGVLILSEVLGIIEEIVVAN